MFPGWTRSQWSGIGPRLYGHIRDLVRMLMEESKQLGRSGSCHLFRHTCAAHLLEGGADIRFIEQLLGHEKLETTAIYTELSIKQLQDVHVRCHPAEQASVRLSEN